MVRLSGGLLAIYASVFLLLKNTDTYTAALGDPGFSHFSSAVASRSWYVYNSIRISRRPAEVEKHETRAGVQDMRAVYRSCRPAARREDSWGVRQGIGKKV